MRGTVGAPASVLVNLTDQRLEQGISDEGLEGSRKIESSQCLQEGVKDEQPAEGRDLRQVDKSR